MTGGVAANFFSGYAAGAVNFDGSTYLRRNNNIGASNSKLMVFSVFFKPTFGSKTQNLLWAETSGTASVLQIGFGVTGTAFVSAASSAGSVVYSASTGALVNDGQWNHMLVSIDAATSGQYAIVVNDSPAILTPSTTNTTINFSGIGDIYLGSNTVGNDNFTGDMAEAFMITGYGPDISATANRRKFISASGKPVSLGSDGSKPFAAQPELYFRGNATDFVTNAGDGGAFTETGTITTASGVVGI